MSWHNYFALIHAKQFFMNRENEKKNLAPDKQEINTNPHIDDRHFDNDQPGYGGKLDHVEGQMNNGEIGGGIKKEEE